MLRRVTIIIFIFFFNNLCSISQTINWVDSCSSYAYRGQIVQPFYMKNSLRAHFVLENNDALLVANVTIPSTNLFGIEESRVLIQRVNSNGDSLWAKFIGFPSSIIDSNSYCYTAKRLRNGDIVLVFMTTVNDNYGPIFVRLDNITGNIIWVKQHNLFTGGAGVGLYISKILEDKFGDLVCVGSMMFDGLVMKIKSTNGDMLFTKRYTVEWNNNFMDVVETENNYMLLGGTSTSDYSMNLLCGIQKMDGLPSYGYSIDSTPPYGSPIIYESVRYENGIFHLQGNAFTYAINSPIISSFLSIDTNGSVLSSKLLKSNTINKSYYPFTRGGSDNYDYKNRIGISSVTNVDENEAHIYKLNESQTNAIWSNVIAYPETDLFAGIIMSKDSSLILGGVNIDSVNGYTAMLVKTLPNGTMGICPTLDFPIHLKDTNTIVKKRLLTENTFFYLNSLTPNIVSYNASGYQWQVTCNTAQTCRLSKTMGKQMICKNDTATYFNKFSGFCSNKINYTISGAGATILATTDTTVQIVFEQNGSFKLLASMQAQCGTLKDSIIITAKSATKPVISPVSSICKGDSVTLYTTPNNYINYWWSTSALAPQINVSDTGVYSIIVKDVDGCIAYDTMHISQLLNKPIHFLPKDTTICRYLPIYVKPSISFLQYIWNTGSSQVPLKINRAGLYVLQVKNANGCIGKDSIQINENGCKQWVRFPTAFTPNNDGKNDVWKAYTYGSVELFSIQVFNRWGQKIFSTNDAMKGWDGLNKGQQIQEGTYVVTASYKLEDEPVQHYKGFIQVIR